MINTGDPVKTPPAPVSFLKPDSNTETMHELNTDIVSRVINLRENVRRFKDETDFDLKLLYCNEAMYELQDIVEFLHKTFNYKTKYRTEFDKLDVELLSSSCNSYTVLCIFRNIDKINEDILFSIRVCQNHFHDKSIQLMWDDMQNIIKKFEVTKRWVKRELGIQ